MTTEISVMYGSEKVKNSIHIMQVSSDGSTVMLLVMSATHSNRIKLLECDATCHVYAYVSVTKCTITM